MTLSTLTRPAFAVAAFAMLATAAVPSMASARGNTSGNAPAPMASTEQAPKKICLSPTVTGDPTVTGSMLAKRACHTKAEWEAKGVLFGSK